MAGYRRFLQGNLILGLLLIGTVMGMALVSLLWTPHPVTEMTPQRLTGPGPDHWFGTDHFGRDIFSRVMAGAASALGVGVVAVGIGVTVGVTVGAVAGLHGGWLDEVLMRFIDGLYAFPALLMALLVISVLGPGLFNTMIAIGIAFVPVFARLTRASFLSLREQEFVEAARALGATDLGLIRRHLLPNAMAPIIVQATVSFAIAVLAEAALSYLGLGTQPPYPSWGRMLSEAQRFLFHSQWFAIFPGLSIGLTVLGFNLLGDGLRDVLDPQTSRDGGGAR